VGREGDLLMTTEQMDQKDREARDTEALYNQAIEETKEKRSEQVHLFEMRGDTEIPVFIEWMDDLLPGAEFDTPPVGSIVIVRNGTYDVFVPKGWTYTALERRQARLALLNTFGDLPRARDAEKWVFGE